MTHNEVAVVVDKPPLKLLPSDFAFLWEECKSCFYRKVRQGIARPSVPMAKIFRVIDTKMGEAYGGVRTETLGLGIPKGEILEQQQFVQSATISLPGHELTCYILGRYDTIMRLDDGGYGVIDFKTSSTRSEHIPLYGRQLHSYAFALENPAPGKPSLSPVTTLGLIVFEPDSYEHQAAVQRAHLSGPIAWLPIERDDAVFLSFIGEVLTVLELPVAPPATQGCPFCRYLQQFAK